MVNLLMSYSRHSKRPLPEMNYSAGKKPEMDYYPPELIYDLPKREKMNNFKLHTPSQ